MAEGDIPIRMKRYLGQWLMIGALAAMTAGVMPAPTAVERSYGMTSASISNIHTYGEQSSTGNPFGTWLQSFVLIIP